MGPEKLFNVCRVFIQDQSFNNFENDTMKLSVNEAKLTGLWARNCATIQQALISKFAFRARKVIGTFETRAPRPANIKESLSKNRESDPVRDRSSITFTAKDKRHFVPYD